MVNFSLSLPELNKYMRIPRIFHPEILPQQGQVSLSDEAAHHISRVLRMQAGQDLLLFDGSGAQCPCVIKASNKKSVIVDVLERVERSLESPLYLHLGQVLSRGEKMEFTIQKSVELGVNVITPLISERCGVKLNAERLDKKWGQWQKIAIAACEQCGRNVVPQIRPVMTLEAWAQEAFEGLKLNLHPRAKYSINTLPEPVYRVRLLVGPEGGLSKEEIEKTQALGFEDTLLGPRILRTETAALTAITALQVRFGDLG